MLGLPVGPESLHAYGALPEGPPLPRPNLTATSVVLLDALTCRQMYMHTHVRRDMCRGPPRDARSHTCTQNKHIYTHRRRVAARLPPGIPAAPRPTTQAPAFRTLSPASRVPGPLLCPGTVHLAKLSLQFLLKMLWFVLRRFFVSLKTFLIFSSAQRGDSEKFRTQAWRESRSPG